MTTATQNQIKVGAKALYRERYGAPPVETTIIHVSPTGKNIKVAAKAGVSFAKRYTAAYEETGYGKGHVIAFTEENLAKWTEEAHRHEADARAKKAEEVRRQRTRLESEAAELAEVKAAFGNVALVPATRQELPDGTRLYTVQMPVKLEYAKSKKGYEILMVRCRDREEMVDYSTGATAVRVETTCTWLTGNSGFGSSSGGPTYASDVEALWDICRQRYHDGW